MKRILSTIFLIAALALPVFAQVPILELKDNKIRGREFTLTPELRYKFFSFPGTRPSEGVAVLEKAPKCLVKFKDIQPTHTITVNADICLWIGTVTVVRLEVGGFASYELTDSKADKPAKK